MFRLTRTRFKDGEFIRIQKSLHSGWDRQRKPFEGVHPKPKRVFPRRRGVVGLFGLLISIAHRVILPLVAINVMRLSQRSKTLKHVQDVVHSLIVFARIIARLCVLMVRVV